jgi:hypothetical protein
MTYVLKCPNQVVPQRRSLYREPRRSEPARTDPEVDRTTFRLLFRPRNPRGPVKRRQRRLFRVSSRTRRLCRFSTRSRFSTGIVATQGHEKGAHPWLRVDAPSELERYSALSSSVTSETDFLASPKSIEVPSAKKSGFSIPAKPEFIERLSTMTDFDWSTLRIGIP